MVAQHILEHSSYMTPDPDGFKCAIKNIVKAHSNKPFNVSKYGIRESPKKEIALVVQHDREIVCNFLDVTLLLRINISLFVSRSLRTINIIYIYMHIELLLPSVSVATNYRTTK